MNNSKFSVKRLYYVFFKEPLAIYMNNTNGFIQIQSINDNFNKVNIRFDDFLKHLIRNNKITRYDNPTCQEQFTNNCKFNGMYLDSRLVADYLDFLIDKDVKQIRNKELINADWEPYHCKHQYYNQTDYKEQPYYYDNNKPHIYDEWSDDGTIVEPTPE